MNAGRELDALIAEKVMELEVTRALQGPFVVEVWYVEARSEKARGWDALVTNWYPVVVPHYSTDIAAAWEVVEKLQADGRTIVIVASSGGNRQACLIGNVGAAPFPVEDLPLHGKVYLADSVRISAATAPLAICLAALRDVGYEIPK